jgi:sugar O-acyltransferase (sialic acid O-acetyltransferase NeuD family)
MTDLVICGVGPFARLMHYYFSHDSAHRVVAFTADERYLSAPSFCGLPAVPFECIEKTYPPSLAELFVAIGYRRMRDRMRLFERARALNYVLASYVSSQAVRFPDLEIGQNNVAMPGVTFEPFARVGDHNVFWSGTLVCHDAVVGNGNYMGAKCLVGGNSVVRDGCFLGNGAILIDGVELAEETHILPGSTVLQSTRPFRKYHGNPAREVGSHEQDGIVIERG